MVVSATEENEVGLGGRECSGPQGGIAVLQRGRGPSLRGFYVETRGSEGESNGENLGKNFLGRSETL